MTITRWWSSRGRVLRHGHPFFSDRLRAREEEPRPCGELGLKNRIISLCCTSVDDLKRRRPLRCSNGQFFYARTVHTVQNAYNILFQNFLGGHGRLRLFSVLLFPESVANHLPIISSLVLFQLFPHLRARSSKTIQCPEVDLLTKHH